MTQFPSRKWKYVEPGPNNEPVETVVTDEDIIRDFFPWWSGEMKRLGREDLISHKNCIEDYVVVNWAEEVK